MRPQIKVFRKQTIIRKKIKNGKKYEKYFWKKQIKNDPENNPKNKKIIKLKGQVKMYKIKKLRKKTIVRIDKY